MNGRRVLAALALIVVLTAVLPPAAAIAVNRSRVGRATAEVASMAATLSRAGQELRNTAPGALDAYVLCGPGRLPLAETPAAQPWVTTPRAALSAVLDNPEPLPSDPWGNCYVVNLAANLSPESADQWVLSAGPNGIIDTPFLGRARTPAGDDIAMSVR